MKNNENDLDQLSYDDWYNQMYLKMYPDLCRYLTSFTRSKLNVSDSIDECINDAFVLLWKKGENFRNEHPHIEAWLCSVSGKKMLHVMRKMRRMQKNIGLDDVEIEDTSRYDEEATKELLDYIATKYGPETFKLLVDYYHQDKSNYKLAEEENISWEALKKRVGRMVKKIRSEYTLLLMILSVAIALLEYKIRR